MSSGSGPVGQANFIHQESLKRVAVTALYEEVRADENQQARLAQAAIWCADGASKVVSNPRTGERMTGIEFGEWIKTAVAAEIAGPMAVEAADTAQ